MLDLIDVNVESVFSDLGRKLSNILGGDVEVTLNERGDKEIRFKIDDGKVILNLITSSSMVQQLSTLSLYLKHVAKFGDLIIIDEPESNLHPEAQVKFAELIAEMVNRGLWVIITTHTPFILESLNVFMKAYVIAQKNEELKKQVMEVVKNENALLNPDLVGVYLFKRDGTIENIKKDYVIDEESFRKVFDELGSKFTELLIIEDIYESYFDQEE